MESHQHSPHNSSVLILTKPVNPLNFLFVLSTISFRLMEMVDNKNKVDRNMFLIEWYYSARARLHASSTT